MIADAIRQKLQTLEVVERHVIKRLDSGFRFLQASPDLRRQFVTDVNPVNAAHARVHHKIGARSHANRSRVPASPVKCRLQLATEGGIQKTFTRVEAQAPEKVRLWHCVNSTPGYEAPRAPTISNTVVDSVGGSRKKRTPPRLETGFS